MEKADSEEEGADQLLSVLLAVVVLAKINTNKMRSQIIPSRSPTMSARLDRCMRCRRDYQGILVCLLHLFPAKPQSVTSFSRRLVDFSQLPELRPNDVCAKRPGRLKFVYQIRVALPAAQRKTLRRP